MTAALKDASETAFLAAVGRWVKVDLEGESHSEIVCSTLPEYSGPTSAMGLFGLFIINHTIIYCLLPL